MARITFSRSTGWRGRTSLAEFVLVLVPRVATHGIDACEDYNTSGIVLDAEFMARSAKPLRKPYDLRPGEADVRQVDRLNVNHNGSVAKPTVLR